MKIIDGKALSEKIKDEIVKEIAKLKNSRPSLAIILVGDKEDSVLYVNLKIKEAKRVGIDTHFYKCPGNIAEEEIFNMIDCLNKDESVDGILVQLPLPPGYDTDGIIKAINSAKDVDGFHPDNLEELFKQGSKAKVISPVFEAVLEMLASIKYNIENKKICVVSNSEIFGKSLAQFLKHKGARVQITGPDEKDFNEKTTVADILITAVGKPNFIKKSMVKKDAIIIDIGITKKGKKVYGDVDFEDVKDKVSHITPVPGGVGPMTIALAFRNTLKIFKTNKGLL